LVPGQFGIENATVSGLSLEVGGAANVNHDLQQEQQVATRLDLPLCQNGHLPLSGN